MSPKLLPRYRLLNVFFIATVISIFGMILSNILTIGSDYWSSGNIGDGYLQIASMIFSGEGFRFEPGGSLVMHRPPLYSYLIAPLTSFPIAIQRYAIPSLNAIFAGTSTTLIYYLTVNIFNCQRSAVAAIVIFLINPWLHRLITTPHTAMLQSMIFLAIATTLFTLVINQRVKSPLSPKKFFLLTILYGVLGGTLGLTHGAGFAVFSISWLGLMAIILKSNENNKFSRIASVLLAGAIGGAIISTWSIRNANNFSITFPVTTGAPLNYFVGNVYWDTGGHNFDPEKSLKDNALFIGGVKLSEKDVIQYWGVIDPNHELTLQNSFKEHILKYPGSVIKKVVLTSLDIFIPATHWFYCSYYNNVSCANEGISGTVHRFGISIYMGSILVLAFVSIKRHKAKRGPIFLLLFLAVLHILPYLPLGQWAPHGIYALSSLTLLIVIASGALFNRKDKADRYRLN